MSRPHAPRERPDRRVPEFTRPVGRAVWMAGLAIATSALAACGGDGGDDALQTIDPVAMQATVEALAKDMQLPGAVVILKTPQGDSRTAYSVTTYKGSTPTTFDQKIRVGSITKSWVGIVVLQQVQEGKLSLTDPVSKHWSGVLNGDRITIEQLLNMRSHLYNYKEGLTLNQALDAQPQKAWTQQELLALGFAQPLYTEDFHYSNTNTVLLGLIAQKLDGNKPLENILRDRLFTPLGLQGSSFPAIGSNAIRPVCARLHGGHQRRDDEPVAPATVAVDGDTSSSVGVQPPGCRPHGRTDCEGFDLL